MNVLFIGDIVGDVGIKAVKENVFRLKKESNIDLVIANCENMHNGRGISKNKYNEIRQYGVDITTAGNHVWFFKEIYDFIDDNEYLLRPLNYPKGIPGKGSCIYNYNGEKIGIINLIGRVNMDMNYNCPFAAADKEVQTMKDQGISKIIIDIHAETTAEKIAFANYFDGRVSLIVGTHTHVQTADEKILNNGTGYITDLGMTGPKDSVIGLKTQIAIKRFIQQIPHKYEVADGRYQFNAVVANLDNNNKCAEIRRINFCENE